MYKTGDRVVYGAHGVCMVMGEDVQKEGRQLVRYLVLEPLGQTDSRFLLPAENPVAMAKVQSVLTPQEVEDLLRCEAVHTDCWIPEENMRKQIYRELIASGDRMRLLSMVNALYRHKREQAAAGKKVHLCDDNFLRDAEKLLISEFSVVLEMDPGQTRSYIRQVLEQE